MVQDGIILTEKQVAALEKTKEQKEANGEIETQHPGYLGSQDTYYVGNIKGIVSTNLGVLNKPYASS